MQAQPIELTRNWTWDDYAPYFDALKNTELTKDNIDQWLSDWTAFYSTYTEAWVWIGLDYDLDTNNEAAEKAINTFYATITPEITKAQFELSQKLLESGFVPEGLEVTIKQMRSVNEVYRPENVDIQVKVQELVQKYSQISGSQSITWEGEERTISWLKKLNAERDRDLRKKAWLAISDRRLQDREALNNLWSQLMGLRKDIYQNADMPDFRAYTWKQYARLDYTPEDVLAYCEAVEKTVVPVVAKLREHRRQRLGLDSLRPWDTAVEPHDVRVPLTEHSMGELYKDTDDLVAKLLNVFNNLDPKLGEFYQTMKDNGWLFLGNTPGKAPGAYCAPLPVSHGALMFGNATGLAPDISMVLHESGHGFHNFHTADQPHFVEYQGIPTEFAEVASTAMEFLAMPYLAQSKGGFFSDEDLAHYMIGELTSAVEMWAYNAVVVLFQHWAYTNHDLASDPAECDKKWTELWLRYSPNVDYSGVEEWVATGWHRKGHIYAIPFYYIEYAFAQLGAVQIWNNAQNDQVQALKAYREGLALGNSVSLPELFKAAGAELKFDVDTLSKAVGLVKSKLDELNAQVGLD